MANRIPLIVNPTASQIQELPSGDALIVGNGGLGVLGNCILGDSSATDTISLNSRFASSLIPSDTNRDLGDSVRYWDEAYISKVNVVSNEVSTTTTTGALQVTGGVGVGGALNVGGDVTAFASSDVTLKENITPISNAIDKVLSISGNTFTWNEKSVYNGEEGTGIIAQEIEALGLPGVTQTREDGTKAVRYDRLVPLLIEAIKELSNKVKSLEK